MSRLVSSLAPLLLLGSLASCSSTDSTRQSMHLHYGERTLEDEDGLWGDFAEHGVARISFDSLHHDTGFGAEFSIGGSRQTEEVVGVDVDLDLLDVSLGVRRTFQRSGGWFHPYVSAGITYIAAEFEAEGSDSEIDDQAAGFYAAGGAYWRFAEKLHVGAEYRRLFSTEFDDDLDTFDAENDSVSVFLGISF